MGPCGPKKISAKPTPLMRQTLKGLSFHPSGFGRREKLLRKEVIQPHLPVGLPCYDLVLLTSHTFADTLLAVG